MADGASKTRQRLFESRCDERVFPQAQLNSDEAKEQEQRERMMVGDTRRKTGGTGCFVFLPLFFPLSF